MRFPIPANFVARSVGNRITGVIRPATEADLLAWTRWRYRPSDEDQTWDWWSIFVECAESKGRCECYAAVTDDDVQGLAVLDLKPGDAAQHPTVVVDYLATNPCNRERTAGLKHIGLAMMAAAVRRSIECGAEGRTRLEALPGAAAFYDNIGMSRQQDRSSEGNLIYRLAPGMAQQFLEEIKTKGILQL